MKALSEADGISSQEDEVAGLLSEVFRSNGLTVERDSFGNVLAYKSIKNTPVVYAAHMDEIGFMVKHIDKKGFIKFIKIGGIDDRLLLDQPVRLLTPKGKVDGVIGFKPPHITKPEERKSVVDYRQLFIDVGATSDKEVREMGISVGTGAVFASQFKRLGNNRIMGKALDDRIGCYILTELAKDLPENVVLMGTTQEEVSTFGKGAMVGSYKLNPKFFIAVDTTTAGDHPGVSESDAPVSLDKGPVVVLAEAGGRGNIADKTLLSKVLEVSDRENIDVQVEVMEGGATDAASVHNIKEGVPSISISVPTRYIHSSAAVASVKDIDSSIQLFKALSNVLVNV